MEHKLNSIILLPIFIILLMVIFRVVKESLKIDEPINWILSICVSILATFALHASPSGTIGAILIPYKALAISILVIVIVAFIFKRFDKGKDDSAKPKGNWFYEADKSQTNETDKYHKRKKNLKSEINGQIKTK